MHPVLFLNNTYEKNHIQVRLAKSSLPSQAILKYLQELNDIFPHMDVQLCIQPSSQSTQGRLLLIK